MGAALERAGHVHACGARPATGGNSGAKGETAADYQSIERIEPLIKPWLGDTPAEQLRLVRVTAYTFRAQVASRWRDRNVFVLGDAAHLTPPFVGQGMAAGLRDALNRRGKWPACWVGPCPKACWTPTSRSAKPMRRP